MRRVLVTGATGFIGANLARRLLDDGDDVHLLVRPGQSRWRISDILSEVHLHEADIADEQAVKGGIASARPEWVFHLAVYGAYPTQGDARQMIQTNLVGTMNLVEACLAAGVETVVNTGSSSEYGLKDHPPTEDEPLEPNSHYALTKGSATAYCRFIGQREALQLRTLRLYSIFGPWEEPSRLMPTLILHGLAGGLPRLAAPDIARDYVFVDDAVEAYLLAASVQGQDAGAVYNVGTGVQTSLAQVVDRARAELEIRDEPEWQSMPNRLWDTAIWVADTRKIRAHLEWSPRFSFGSGFQTFVSWFRSQPALCKQYRERLGLVG